MEDTGFMRNIEVKTLLNKEWYWIKSNNIIESSTDEAMVLSQLNTIKIDVITIFI